MPSSVKCSHGYRTPARLPCNIKVVFVEVFQIIHENIWNSSNAFSTFLEAVTLGPQMQELWPLHVKPSEVEAQHSSDEAKVVEKITTVMRVVIYVYPLEPPSSIHMHSL